MNGQGKKRRKSGERGNAVVEASLLVPWILFLFMGVFDFGFYAYALIATENAARVAALYTSSNLVIARQEWMAPSPPSKPGACQYVLGELKKLPNVGTNLTGCSALPVKVTVYQPTPQADGSFSSRVSVTYQSVQLFSLPWMMGRLTATRTAEMRVLSF